MEILTYATASLLGVLPSLLHCSRYTVDQIHTYKSHLTYNQSHPHIQPTFPPAYMEPPHSHVNQNICAHASSAVEHTYKPR
jgi:hypothetical protein